jgi:vacuolar-type H+-ATPase subunit I/STV1
MPIFWSYEREKQIRDKAYAEGKASEQKNWIFRWKLFVENIRLHTQSFDQSLENIENAEALSLGLVAYIRSLKDRNASLQNDNERLRPSQVPILERKIADLQSELTQVRQEMARLQSEFYDEQFKAQNLSKLLETTQHEKPSKEKILLALQNRLDQQGKKSVAKSS